MRHNRRPEVTNVCCVVCSPNRRRSSSAPNGFLIALRRDGSAETPPPSPTPRITVLSMSYYRSCEKPLHSLRSSTSRYRPVRVKENRQTSRPTSPSVEIAPKTIRTKRFSSGSRFFALDEFNTVSVVSRRLTTSSEQITLGEGRLFFLLFVSIEKTRQFYDGLHSRKYTLVRSPTNYRVPINSGRLRRQFIRNDFRFRLCPITTMEFFNAAARSRPNSLRNKRIVFNRLIFVL